MLVTGPRTGFPHDPDNQPPTTAREEQPRGWSSTTDRTVTDWVEFDSLPAANTARDDWEEYVCPIDDDRRKTQVAFISDTPEAVLDAIEVEAQDARTDSRATSASVELTADERERISDLGGFDQTTTTLSWASAKGVFSREGMGDKFWDAMGALTDYDDPAEGAQSWIDDRRNADATLGTGGASGGTRDDGDTDEQRQRKAGKAAAKARTQGCDRAHNFCEGGDEEACQHLREVCGYDEDEVRTILGDVDDRAHDDTDQRELVTVGGGEFEEMEVTPQVAGALRDSWTGYKAGIGTLADAVEDAQEAAVDARQALAAINSIREKHGQDEMHGDRLHDLLDVLDELPAAIPEVTTLAHFQGDDQGDESRGLSVDRQRVVDDAVDEPRSLDPSRLDDEQDDDRPDGRVIEDETDAEREARQRRNSERANRARVREGVTGTPQFASREHSPEERRRARKAVLRGRVNQRTSKFDTVEDPNAGPRSPSLDQGVEFAPESVGKFDLVDDDRFHVRYASEDGAGGFVTNESDASGGWVVLTDGGGQTYPTGYNADVGAAVDRLVESLDNNRVRHIRQLARDSRNLDTNAIRRATSNQVKGQPAQKLASRYDSVEAVARASREELGTIDGVGPATLDALDEHLGVSAADVEKFDVPEEPLDAPRSPTLSTAGGEASTPNDRAMDDLHAALEGRSPGDWPGVKRADLHPTTANLRLTLDSPWRHAVSITFDSVGYDWMVTHTGDGADHQRHVDDVDTALDEAKRAAFRAAKGLPAFPKRARQLVAASGPEYEDAPRSAAADRTPPERSGVIKKNDQQTLEGDDPQARLAGGEQGERGQGEFFDERVEENPGGLMADTREDVGSDEPDPDEFEQGGLEDVGVSEGLRDADQGSLDDLADEGGSGNASSPVTVACTVIGGKETTAAVLDSPAVLGFEASRTTPPADPDLVEFVDFPFSADDLTHAEKVEAVEDAVETHHPEIAVGPDVEGDVDVEDAVEVGDRLLDLGADVVVLTPKDAHPEEVPDRFRVGIPNAGYNGSEAPHTLHAYRDVGDVHVLGGAPQTQLRIADFGVDVASVDGSSPQSGASAGAVWSPDGPPWWPKGYPGSDDARLLTASLHNVVLAWDRRTGHGRVVEPHLSTRGSRSVDLVDPEAVAAWDGPDHDHGGRAGRGDPDGSGERLTHRKCFYALREAGLSESAALAVLREFPHLYDAALYAARRQPGVVNYPTRPSSNERSLRTDSVRGDAGGRLLNIEGIGPAAFDAIARLAPTNLYDYPAHADGVTYEPETGAFRVESGSDEVAVEYDPDRDREPFAVVVDVDGERRTLDTGSRVYATELAKREALARFDVAPTVRGADSSTLDQFAETTNQPATATDD